MVLSPNNVPISSSRMPKPEAHTHLNGKKGSRCCSKVAALAGGIGYVCSVKGWRPKKVRNANDYSVLVLLYYPP